MYELQRHWGVNRCGRDPVSLQRRSVIGKRNNRLCNTSNTPTPITRVATVKIEMWKRYRITLIVLTWRQRLLSVEPLNENISRVVVIETRAGKPSPPMGFTS